MYSSLPSTVNSSPRICFTYEDSATIASAALRQQT